MFTLRTAIYVNPWVAALPGAMIFIVDLLQPVERRNAERDGCPSRTCSPGGGSAARSRRWKCAREHFPVRGGFIGKRAWCAPWTM
jgi:hypothetical protein